MKSPALVPRHRGAQTLADTLRALLPAVALALLFVATGVVHVTSRVLVVGAGYRLSQLETTQRALSLENDRLKLELATLKNPSRLERYARSKLGMGPPAPAAVLTPAPLPPTMPMARAAPARQTLANAGLPGDN